MFQRLSQYDDIDGIKSSPAFQLFKASAYQLNFIREEGSKKFGQHRNQDLVTFIKFRETSRTKGCHFVLFFTHRTSGLLRFMGHELFMGIFKDAATAAPEQ